MVRTLHGTVLREIGAQTCKNVPKRAKTEAFSEATAGSSFRTIAKADILVKKKKIEVVSHQK